MKKNTNTINASVKWSISIFIVFFCSTYLHAQFVHPGCTHNQSDLDRMKYMVDAGIDPWLTTFNSMQAVNYSSYNYNVVGSPSNTTISSLPEFENDGNAAYHNALMWCITEDERHAQKSVEILNAWANITRIENQFALSNGGALWRMVEAAEIIKHTYDGWADEDVEKFKAMLVYPGWSGTEVPTAAMASKDVSFYWNIYQGDPARHGNQGLFAYRSLMAMGIFLDNEVIYDRALRYLQGLDHRPDDLPYPSGPPVTTPKDSGTEYYDEWNQTSRSNTIQDYGYNEVMEHYIWENGQSQESSRDQAHALGGVSIIAAMCEIAWNQGDDLYGHLDNRPLLGMEFYLHYNLSWEHSYPDQATPWEPTFESGEFIQRIDRTGRWKSLKMNPYVAATSSWSRGGQNLTPIYEMSLGHYRDRMLLDPSQYKWLQRGFDALTNAIGFEDGAHPGSHPGWGGLKFRRVSPGDPISGFVSDTIPVFAMNVVPTTIEAENFDYFPIDGEGLTYHDNDAENTSSTYRLTQGVDIEDCSEGGYQLTSLEDGEWLLYTIQVPETSLYNISIRYASANADGKIKLSFDGQDKTEEITVPFGGDNSTGLTDWKDLVVATDVILSQGVQAMKISISGASNAFVLNNITIEDGSDHVCDDALPSSPGSNRFINGIDYNYYEGDWDALPDFETITPMQTGVSDQVELIDELGDENFAMVYDGYISIPVNGTYTFYLNSGDASRVLIDGVEVMTNDGSTNNIEISGEVCLDDGFHTIRVEYLNKTGSQDISFMYSGPATQKQYVSELFAIGPCENVGVSVSDDIISGIQYKYYEGEWTSIPNFTTLTPVDEGWLSAFSLSPAQIEDYFALTFTGYIYLETEGDYTFYTNSDDGSNLYIDDFHVVDNDGTHGVIEKSGTLCLAPGYHKIRVDFLESTGGQSLEVSYQGPDFAKKTITELYTDPFDKEDQVITFEALESVTYGDVLSVRPVVSSSSALDVTLTSSDKTVAEVAFDNKIWLRGVGTAVITASQEGNMFFNAAEDVQHTLVVNEQVASSIGELNANNQFIVYPNPVSDNITIEVEDYTNATLEIINSMGTIVLTRELTTKETLVNVANLSKGVYFVQVRNDKFNSLQKIVKEE